MEILGLIIALLLTLSPGGEPAKNPADTVKGDIPIVEEGDYYGDECNYSEYYYSDKVIADGQQALELACTVYYMTDPNSDRVPNRVYYYPQNGIYVVVFGMDYDPNDRLYALGNTASVALDERDGRVISILYHE